MSTGHTCEFSIACFLIGLNIFLIFLPIAWASHYGGWSPGRTFTRTYLSYIFRYGLTNVLSVSFMTIIALEKLFDWGGEQLAMYCGPDLGDLIIVTLNKCVRLISPSFDGYSDRDLRSAALSKLPSPSFSLYDASMCL